jgi:hypothetical protein
VPTSSERCTRRCRIADKSVKKGVQGVAGVQGGRQRSPPLWLRYAEVQARVNFFSDLAVTQAITAAMTFRQKLSLLAAATLLFPFLASAQEQASKYHYDGIYKGTVPIDLLINANDKHRAKAQLVFYPDGRLLVLTVESPQVRNPLNIKGALRKSVFTGDWKKGFFSADLSFQSVFHGGATVVTVTAKGKKPEKWFFTKVSGG